ncbi:MAG: cation transporter [Bacteroidetes bacterium]|nr:cation transporter [Bacteroidota bacterium]
MNKIKIIVSILFLFCSNLISAQTDTLKVQTSAECGTCKKKLEKELVFEKGVKSVNLNLDTKVVTVVYSVEKTNADKIRAAISKIGYAADSIPADKKAYDRLPDCCKKDGMK